MSNQPIFNIGKVNAVNHGDTIIQGDQVGLVVPYDPNSKSFITILVKLSNTSAWPEPEGQVYIDLRHPDQGCATTEKSEETIEFHEAKFAKESSVDGHWEVKMPLSLTPQFSAGHKAWSDGEEVEK